MSALVGSLGITAPQKCNVVGPQDLSDADGDGLPDDCDLADWVVQTRAIVGMAKVGAQCGVTVSVPPGTAFFEELNDIFNEEKCTTCHGFTNGASGKRLAHEADGRLQPGVDVTRNASCSGCHNANNGFVDDWRAAPAIMDWTGMSSLETCNLIKANLTSAAAMQNHFRNDERVLWSLDRIGIDTNTWFAIADRWIQAGGMRCE